MACADERFDKLVLKMLYHFVESLKSPNVNQHESWVSRFPSYAECVPKRNKKSK
jgi:hypothetical protein